MWYARSFNKSTLFAEHDDRILCMTETRVPYMRQQLFFYTYPMKHRVLAQDVFTKSETPSIWSNRSNIECSSEVPNVQQ